MTRLTALIELRDKVKAGHGPTGSLAERPLRGHGGNYYAAYHGSLDAAQVLHEAVLPGWDWTIFKVGPADFVAVLDGPEVSTPELHARTPSRAWLLSILEALIAQEQET